MIKKELVKTGIVFVLAVMILVALSACSPTNSSSNDEDVSAVNAAASYVVADYRPNAAPVQDSEGYDTWVEVKEFKFDSCNYASSQSEGRIYNAEGTVSYYCDTTADGISHYGPFEWRGQFAVDDSSQVTVKTLTVENCSLP